MDDAATVVLLGLLGLHGPVEWKPVAAPARHLQAALVTERRRATLALVDVAGGKPVLLARFGPLARSATLSDDATDLLGDRVAISVFVPAPLIDSVSEGQGNAERPGELSLFTRRGDRLARVFRVKLGENYGSQECPMSRDTTVRAGKVGRDGWPALVVKTVDHVGGADDGCPTESDPDKTVTYVWSGKEYRATED